MKKYGLNKKITRIVQEMNNKAIKSIETFCLRRNLEIESCIDLWKGKKMPPTHIGCFSSPGKICTGMHAAEFDTKSL